MADSSTTAQAAAEGMRGMADLVGFELPHLYQIAGGAHPKDGAVWVKRPSSVATHQVGVFYLQSYCQVGCYSQQLVGGDFRS